MLVRDDDGRISVIGQAAHAWLSAQIGRAWGNARFAPPTAAHREEVLLAALQHDVGMAEWDRHPDLDRRGDRPVSFLEMPLRTHLSLWSAAPGRLTSQSLHAALLVSMHGTALYARRDLDALEPGDRIRVETYLAGQRALQAELIARLELDPDEVRRHQQLLFAWDGLSLAVCLGGWPRPLNEIPLVAGGTGEITTETLSEERFSLDPWPFAEELDALEVRAESRTLTGHFADAGELHAALATAPVEIHRATLVRDRSGGS